jgi:hypothetical protein
MPFLRGAIVVGGAGILTVWLVAASIAPSRPIATRAAPAAFRAVTDRSGGRQFPITRFRAALAAMPGSRGVERDPFRFRTRSSPAAGERRVSTGAAPQLSGEPRPPRPELQLLGIAEDTHDGTVVRNAVISSMNQLYLVGEGEQMALRFLIKRVRVDSVDVEDLAEGVTFRIALSNAQSALK